MASIPAPTPDTLVTLKINIGGINRRFKLPLRDLVPNTLADKLRCLLAIPSTSEAIFERYSDSAAAFILLDANNSSVYKQLYRAAKAKLKLRLKVTIKDKEPVVPKPATVEDEEPSPAKRVKIQDVTPTSVSDVMKASKHPQQFQVGPEVRESAQKDKETKGAAAWASMHKKFDELALDPHATRPYGDPKPSPWIPSRTGFSPKPFNPDSAARDSGLREEHPRELRDIIEGFSGPLAPIAPAPPESSAPGISVFSVYCNNCNVAIPDIHYHCSTCDGGDFDLCPQCNDSGVTCNGDHWLIKRVVDQGKYIHSTTETLPPKKQFSNYATEYTTGTIAPQKPFSDSKITLVAPAVEEEKVSVPTRTCNCCISELPEESFVTCTDCEDFDLCIQCHILLKHGHNPKHTFAFVDEDANHGFVACALLAPGRHTPHNAICDGCNKYIFGVRHKCLDCPDWDFCNSCIVTADFIHPHHIFVPIYESLSTVDPLAQVTKNRHPGILCDGPLCNPNGRATGSYITGDRYKCAVCDDTDFCARCEASPSNPHNKTHPLLKFRTPVRNVSVTTYGDHANGRHLPPMGDRRPDSQTISKATETTPASSTNAITQILPVAELKPIEVKTEEPIKTEEPVKVEESAKELPALVCQELIAHFVLDTVSDGTVMTPNSVFEQTWYLRNGGMKSWPAGCSVRFVGGDNLCAVDPDHPASIHELVNAAESTTCDAEVAPGQEHGFTVSMRTPSRAGNFISYWRLTTPTGEKFGPRLWCDITVLNEPTPVIEEELKEEDSRSTMVSLEKSVDEGAHKVESHSNDDAASLKADGSQMIFPKLDKESPISSMHEEAQYEEVQHDQARPATEEVQTSEETFNDDYVEFHETFEIDEAEEDGFMTDEEYDILDASDEEYLAEQVSASRK